MVEKTVLFALSRVIYAVLVVYEILSDSIVRGQDWTSIKYRFKNLLLYIWYSFIAKPVGLE